MPLRSHFTLRWTRPSIAHLLATIALLGLCLASLRSGSLAWAGSILTTCILLLTLAITAATSLRGRRRAFWAGFSLAGWLYLAMSSCPGLGPSFGPKLVTTASLDLLYHFAYPRLSATRSEPSATDGGKAAEAVRVRFGLGDTLAMDRGAADRDWYKSLGLERDYFGWGGGTRLHSPKDYRRIGHAWMALLVASIAGRGAARLHGSQDGGAMSRSARFHWLAVVALLATGFLALRSPNRLEANALFSAALASLAMAPIAAAYRRGRERAFWIGFALCGWIYLVLTSFPILDTHVGVHLLTTPAIDLLYGRLAHRPPSTGPFSYDAWSDWTSTALNFTRRYVGDVVLVSSEEFMRIGHSVACLLVAIGGGRFAMSLFGRAGEGLVAARDHPVSSASETLSSSSSIPSSSSSKM